MEKEIYTAYDLEPDEKDLKDSDVSDVSNVSDGSDDSDGSDVPDNSADSELEDLIRELGAAKIVALVKDGRNAAIRQILDELEQQSDHTLPSGISAANHASSIFDLAMQA